MAGGIVGAAGSSGAGALARRHAAGLRRDRWRRDRATLAAPARRVHLQAAAGTEGATLPFWSPDSRSVGFFLESRIRRIEVGSGVSQTIAAVPDLPRGASWGAGDVILISSGTPAQLSRVPATGGPATPIPARSRRQIERAPVWPQFLPDGRHFLYWTSCGRIRCLRRQPGLDRSRLHATPSARERVSCGLRATGRSALHPRGQPDEQPFDARSAHRSQESQLWWPSRSSATPLSDSATSPRRPTACSRTAQALRA